MFHTHSHIVTKVEELGLEQGLDQNSVFYSRRGIYSLRARHVQTEESYYLGQFY